NEIAHIAQRLDCRLVLLAPARERGNHDAAVRRQRRTCSRVSRTISAVSVGISRSVTATNRPPRRSKRIGVAWCSISRRPSTAFSSSSCPGLKPSSSRNRFGTTIRPAESMVVIMAESYHRGPCVRRHRQRKPPRPRPLGPGAPLGFERVQVIVEVDLDRVALGGHIALVHRGLV